MVTSEFELHERDAGYQRTPEPVTGLLRTAWPLPRDTFITDGIPELLTRLSLVRDDSDGDGEGMAQGHPAATPTPGT